MPYSTFFLFSSLLIVYEGDVPIVQVTDTTAVGIGNEYDGDASSSSTDLALSPGHFDMSTLHDEISLDTNEPHEPGEPREPFQPHCEETMGGYEEDEVAPQSPRRHPPSPDSTDSWMAYSSTSSESWRGDAEPEVFYARFFCFEFVMTRIPLNRSCSRIDLIKIVSKFVLVINNAPLLY